MNCLLGEKIHLAFAKIESDGIWKGRRKYSIRNEIIITDKILYTYIILFNPYNNLMKQVFYLHLIDEELRLNNLSKITGIISRAAKMEIFTTM